MKKLKKTYAVYGMMEYDAIVHVGTKSRIRVHFTDGSATAVGVSPAKYTTDNLMYQHAIEHSQEFASGKIKLLHTITTDEDVPMGGDAVGGGDAAGADASEEASVSVSTITPMSFSCVDDARDYLADTFGIKRAELRSKVSIIEQGKAHGLEITINE